MTLTDPPTQANLGTPTRKRGRSLAATEALWGYSFIALWIVGFLIFYFAPMIASFVFTLFNFTLTEPDKAAFIGLANWKRLLFEDPLVWPALLVTFKFALISLPIGMVSALVVAVLLNSKHLLARDLFRTLFYAPTMIPAVAGLLIWQGYLDPTTGWLNRIIEFVFRFDASGAQGIRWGRTYEGYSQDSSLVSELAVAYVEGLKGDGWNTPTAVLASVKHFIADGATLWGSSTRVDRAKLEIDRTLSNAQMDQSFIKALDAGAWQLDQGSSDLLESTLRDEDLSCYAAAIAAGALNVMVSYSSWKGLRLHAHRYLLTEVLKGELGFSGFLVSDWEAVQQLGGDFYSNVVQSVGAGLDMVMVPFEYEEFIATLHLAVEHGDVPLERIDDAVRRILHAKETLGLFEHPRTDPALLALVGSPEHRSVAREAVRKSLVLLKNQGVLPLDPRAKLRVMGAAADDLGGQCGGWTITWMGRSGPITPGTSILEGLRQVAASEAQIHYDPDASSEERCEVGLVVLAEDTYVEGMGDREFLTLEPEQGALLERARAKSNKLVVVLLSGRPLIFTEQLEHCDALVAAWLPGTEGAGVADVLLGQQPFSGKLGFHWPRSHADIPLTPSSKALFELGFGLS